MPQGAISSASTACGKRFSPGFTFSIFGSKLFFVVMESWGAARSTADPSLGDPNDISDVFGDLRPDPGG